MQGYVVQALLAESRGQFAPGVPERQTKGEEQCDCARESFGFAFGRLYHQRRLVDCEEKARGWIQIPGWLASEDERDCRTGFALFKMRQ